MVSTRQRQAGRDARRAWQPRWGPDAGAVSTALRTSGVRATGIDRGQRTRNGGSGAAEDSVGADAGAAEPALRPQVLDRPIPAASAPHGSHWQSGGSSHGHWRVPRRGGRFRRSKDARLIGGVAEGLSKRIGIDVTIVRVGLVLFGLASGTGVAAYVLAWLFLPVEGEDETSPRRRSRTGAASPWPSACVPVLVVAFILGDGHRGGMDRLDHVGGRYRAQPASSSSGATLPPDEHAVLERLANR